MQITYAKRKKTRADRLSETIERAVEALPRCTETKDLEDWINTRLRQDEKPKTGRRAA